MKSFNEYSLIEESAEAGLAAKASKSGISIGTLRKVYKRGVAAWNSGHRPGTTPQQWGMARVNSYITKGKGTYYGADKDLHESCDCKAVDSLTSKLTKPESYEAIDKMMQAISKEADMTPKELHNEFVKKHGKTPDDYAAGLSESESWEAGYSRRVVKTTSSDHKEKGFNWRIKGKERPEISIKLYKEKPSQAEFNKQMKRVAGHEFGEEFVAEAVDKDSDSGLPKKYVAGMSDATAKARAAHFKKADKLSDSDPEAYKPAPGDAAAKTKESKHTKKYREIFGENMDEEIYEACWDTHKQIGVKKKGGKMVPNCVPKNEEVVAEADKHSFIGKIQRGNELKKKVDSSFKDIGTAQKKGDHSAAGKAFRDHERYANLERPGTWTKVKEDITADEQFDLIEEVIMDLAEQHCIDPESIWETLESVDDIELLEYAIDKKGHKSSTGGLTQKGVDAYNAKTGGNLQTAVTTKPSKLKPGSKAANRRKSFCARMGGMPGAMKDDKGRPTRKALALRKWNC